MLFSRHVFIMSLFIFSILALIGGYITCHASWKHLKVAGLIVILCLIRCFIPVEFLTAIPVRSSIVYPFLERFVCAKVIGNITIEQIFCFVWLIGFFFLFIRLCIRLYSQWNMMRKLALPPNHPFYLPYKQIAQKIGISRIGILSQSDMFSSAMMTGFFRPNVLLPNNANTLSNEQLVHIFSHELQHFKGKDLWIKFFLRIFCYMLWWNPAVYFLQYGVESMLELRCDQNVCKKFILPERVLYAHTLLDSIKDSQLSPSIISAGYNNCVSKQNTIHRFNQILDNKTSIKDNILYCVSVIAVILLFVTSYHFTLQPAYESPVIEGEEKVTYINNTNFILQKSDGSLEYFESGIFRGYLTQDMLEEEPYCYMSIYIGK